MEPKSPSKAKIFITRFSHTNWKPKITVIISLSLAFLLAFLLSSLLYKGRSSIVTGSYYRYTVVLDCGSTGTRVHVYQWMPANEPQLPVLIHSYPESSVGSDKNSSCEYHCVQTRPGLDKFVGNASGIRKSVEPLLRLAKKWVPEEFHGETPVFAFATAGLRRLRNADVERVLDDVGDVLELSGFLCKRSWIRVLSGEEEGYYSWVALNFKMGRFQDFPSRIPTLGVIDLGGSSLQVAVEVNESGSGNNEKGLNRLNFGSVEYQVLAYSLPKFGLHDAFERTISMLRTNEAMNDSSGGNYVVRHPCLSSKFEQNLTHYNDWSRSNALDSDTNQEKEIDQLYVTGRPDWKECRRLARNAAVISDQSLPEVGSHREEEASPYDNHVCNLTAITPSNGSFHALSGFFAVYNKLNLSLRCNLTHALDRGRQLCSRSWNTSSGILGSGEFCFQVPYIASLIDDMLGLGNREIMFGPGDISWTLGAVLVEEVFHRINPSEAKLSISSLRTPALLFVLLLFFGLIVYQSQIKLLLPRRVGDAVGVSLPAHHLKRRPI